MVPRFFAVLAVVLLVGCGSPKGPTHLDAAKSYEIELKLLDMLEFTQSAEMATAKQKQSSEDSLKALEEMHAGALKAQQARVERARKAKDREERKR